VTLKRSKQSVCRDKNLAWKIKFQFILLVDEALLVGERWVAMVLPCRRLQGGFSWATGPMCAGNLAVARRRIRFCVGLVGGFCVRLVRSTGRRVLGAHGASGSDNGFS